MGLMAKEVLQKLLWTEMLNKGVVEITYTSRGLPNDTGKVRGTDILRLGKSFWTIMLGGQATNIPYHRITEIRQDNAILFTKPSIKAEKK